MIRVLAQGRKFKSFINGNLVQLRDRSECGKILNYEELAAMESLHPSTDYYYLDKSYVVGKVSILSA